MSKSDIEWKNKVSEWQASGKSIKTWCFEKKIPVTTFYGWKKRFEKLSQHLSSTKKSIVRVKQEFIELKNQQSSDAGIILEIEGVHIHLKPEFDSLVLKRCLACLRGVSC